MAKSRSKRQRKKRNQKKKEQKQTPLEPNSKLNAVPTPQTAEEAAKEQELKRKHAEELQLIRRLMYKREQDRSLGFQAMRRHEFDKARMHFESYLKFSPTDNNEAVTQVLHNLIICRLQGINKQENLTRCVKDCDMLLERSKKQSLPFQSFGHVHLAKINALTRLLNFAEAARCIRAATEEDQKKHIDLLHSYFYQLHDQNKQSHHRSLSHKLELPVSKEELQQVYLSMTLPSRQHLFSFTWEQIHEAIDSSLCAEMLPPNSRPRLQAFLHKCLDYNILNSEMRESKLYFLKQELGCLIAQTLWNHFQLPEKRPEESIPLEKFFVIAESSQQEEGEPKTNKVSVLCEHGMYFAQEGSEFVSSACLDSISLMTHSIGVSHNVEDRRLFVNVNHLHDVGFDLIHFLSENTFSDFESLTDTDSHAAKASDSDWDQYAAFRLLWHEKLDLKAIETLTPPKDNEDPKYFENNLEDVLGKDKTKELLKVEFDASKPILEKYAEIISEISGIDQEIILAELTDEDDFIDSYGDADSNDTSSADNASDEDQGGSDKEQSKEKKYEPIGISLLVQSTQFDLKPSGSEDDTYDKAKIVEKLKALEKDVVQFQIDYKKVVFEEAGEKAGKLKEVMNNISFKGLELTRWLRGFVHYMLERRDIEQQILDYCGAKNAKEWHDWYENLGATMSAAQSIILCLICRMFVSNVFHTYLSERRRLDADLLKRLEDDDQTPEQTQQIDSPDSTTKEEEVQPDTTKDTQEIEEQTIPDVPAILDCVPQFCPSTGHRIETREETFTYHQMINEISQPLMADLGQIKKKLLPEDVKDAIQGWLQNSIANNPGLPEKIEALKSRLGVKQLAIPCVSVPIEVQYVIKFLGTGYNYHKDTIDPTQSLLSGITDDVRVMTLMLDRALKSPETLFHLVYSSNDEKVLGFPTRRAMRMPAAVLCQNCEKLFGTLHCDRCSIAHYCSRECQITKWDSHKSECKFWKKLAENISYYYI